MADKRKRCCAEVWPRNGYHNFPCSRWAKGEFEGKFYCHQHNPTTVRAKRDERGKKYSTEAKMRDWERKREGLKVEAYGLLSLELHPVYALVVLRARIQKHNKERPGG